MPASPPSAEPAVAAQLRFRRALTLLAMTVVLPGTAQRVAGNQRVGRIAGYSFGAGTVLVLLVGLLAILEPHGLVSLSTSLGFLAALRFALLGYAAAWAYLLLDAWRLAEPLKLPQRRRLAVAGCNGVLCLSLTAALLFGSHVVAVQRDFIATVFDGRDVSGAVDGRFNLLLLGGDAGRGRVGLRPDSITVASIDAETGRTVLFGLPRNLQDVPFPEGSELAEKFPFGFNCDGCYLNAVGTWATDHAALFPGMADPGISSTSEAVEEITGLTVNYYALIDLKGFQDLVDAVGGVSLKLSEPIPIGSVGDITDWIPAGTRKLSGYETLWYARSRATSDDYSRMARQKCVLNAMLQQLDPHTVLAHFRAIAQAGKQIMSTSIPASEVDTFIALAGKARALPLASVAFVPPRVDTTDPDWDHVRAMVKDTIDKAEARDAAGTSVSPRHKKNRDANSSTDLAGSC
ncbi:MAG: LCP family protein [Nocardioidaceae bacterium]